MPIEKSAKSQELLRRWIPATVMAAAMVFGGSTQAGELKFNPYVAGQYLYDSNVYKFSRQVAEVTGTPDTADRIQRYTAGLDTGYAWQQQKLSGMVEGRQYRFTNFDHLDHSENTYAANYEGGFLSAAKGLLNYRDERRMASFEDRRSTQLIIERDQIGRGELDVAITPDWHIVTGARRRNLRSPLPAAPALPEPAPGAPARQASPDFALHQTAYNAGVKLGIENKEHPEDEAPLLLGVMGEYQTVTFSGVSPQPAPQPAPGPLPPPPASTRAQTFQDYLLLSLVTTAEYALSGMSSLDAKLGATQYKPKAGGGNSKPDMTGEVGYTRALSALTEINGHLFRRIVPYAATADTTADNGASIGAKWEPIVDFTVLANYAWARSSFRGLSGTAPENSGRSDKVQSATLSVAYPQMRFFYIRLFGTYSDRQSNLSYNDFVDKTVGAELSFRWR